MAFANLVVEVGLNGSAFSRGVDSVIAGAKRMNTAFGTAVTSFAKNQISQAFAVAAVINKVQAGASEAIAFGSAITDLSKTLGVSTDNLQLWNYAATQNGATLGDVSILYQNLARTRQMAVNGSEEEILSYKKLGITIDDLKNKRLEDLAAQIGKAFEAGDPQKLITSLRDVGGRGAGALIAAFEAGIGATFDEGLKLKIVIDPDSLAEIDALGDRLEVVQMKMRPVFVGITLFLTNVVDKINDAAKFLVAATMDLTDPNTYKKHYSKKIEEEIDKRINKAKIRQESNPAKELARYFKTREEYKDEMRGEKIGEISNLNKQYRAKLNAAGDTDVKALSAEYRVSYKRLNAELKELTQVRTPWSALDELARERLDQEKASNKALEDAARKRAKVVPTAPLVAEAITKKLRPVAREKQDELLPKITDSLAKVGGFSMGRDVLTLTVAKQQLAVLETIADNTKDIKPFEGDGLQ